ncbi:Kelch repeat-containing protein [Flagellimonas flava]|uniref:N-acetylneuraminic acid mutarotase n=1 Tax=Flagellimonas flava TaxID=570519 RepID=A0A1M5IY38_9FLAO|nr:kelch repeat-containing protein [Allomuricauda flava]SHG33045.1 N-acetylneuraminic acid mutarotase [Allomuricauda flava]
MKFLKTYKTKKWLVFGLPILAMCIIIACSKDSNDDPADDGTNPDDDPTPAEMTFTDFDPKEGEVGIEVTLTGTNFSTTPSENTVKFGEVETPVKIATATSLKVDVPEGAVTSSLSVTTNGKTVSKANPQFTVIVPNPVPVITGFDPEEGEWGDHITIVGTGFTVMDNNVTINGINAEVLSFEEDDVQFLTVEIGDNTRTGKIEVTNSFDESGESENDLTVFHGRWTQLEDFDGGTWANATTFAIDGKGYVTMGTDGITQSFNEVWEYDPIVDSWDEKDNPFPGIARVLAVSFVIDQTAYVGTGRRNGINYGDFYKYEPQEDMWTQINTFPEADRFSAVGSSTNNHGFVGTGSSVGISKSKDFWQFDPQINDGEWVQISDLPGEARYSSTGFSIADKLYVGTGNTGLIGLNDFWAYDQETAQWTEVASIGTGRSFAAGFSIGDKGYIGMGIDSDQNLLNDFWELDPATNSWTRVADFSGPTRLSSAIFEIDGKAYIIGGTSEGEYFSDVWVFDPGN